MLPSLTFHASFLPKDGSWGLNSAKILHQTTEMIIYTHFIICFEDTWREKNSFKMEAKEKICY